MFLSSAREEGYRYPDRALRLYSVSLYTPKDDEHRIRTFWIMPETPKYWWQNISPICNHNGQSSRSYHRPAVRIALFIERTSSQGEATDELYRDVQVLAQVLEVMILWIRVISSHVRSDDAIPLCREYRTALFHYRSSELQIHDASSSRSSYRYWYALRRYVWRHWTLVLVQIDTNTKKYLTAWASIIVL